MRLRVFRLWRITESNDALCASKLPRNCVESLAKIAADQIMEPLHQLRRDKFHAIAVDRFVQQFTEGSQEVLQFALVVFL